MMKLALHQVFLVCMIAVSVSRYQEDKWCQDQSADLALLSGQKIRMHMRDGDKNMRLELQVLLEGRRWQFVAHEGWDPVDADVACKQLGYERGHRFTGIYDPATSSSFAMTKVNCTGSEPSLQDCRWERSAAMAGLKTVTLQCQQNMGCPRGWHAGFNKCYKFMHRSRFKEKHAAKLCSALGAKLLTIRSREENHFISNILTQYYRNKDNPDVYRQWYAGGKLQRGKWVWSQQSALKLYRRRRHRRTYRRKYRIRLTTRKTYKRKRPIDEAVQMWFPGWSEHRNLSAEPRRGRMCLSLSNTFKDSNGCDRNVEYFFWKSQRCSRKMHYICEHKQKGTKFSLSLTDETRPGAGVVLVEKEGGVGHICADDHWDDQDATVVCRTLGYVRGEADFSHFRSVPKISQLKCTGHELSLHDCPHRSSEHESCKNGMFASVLCYNSSD